MLCARDDELHGSNGIWLLGKIYKVGDSDGWTTKEGTYYEWAEHKEFHVGDSLIFKYDRNVSDVTQVSDAQEYEFCNSSSPKAVYNTGHDIVTLTEPGSHYFISSNHSQCVTGQRLHVGDSNEWSVPEESDFYYKWSEEKQFHVGDNLLFYYNDQVNDVLEVSSDLEFISCDSSSPVATHNTGQDLIKLTKPGIQYFISSKTGQCEAGLKLRVVVRPLFRALPRTRRMRSSPLDRFFKWLHRFRPQPHPHH
ncbi:unnamed protein product [Microthlaspi erraticum]|uniref:Phytocyanin domain-containing protein n=1 Tax=Microthlaspi erraticum TaxID=1685480 RepID=A0A6D2IKJ5_9BRAS|nr:unnamed protein product [Microthlaspi erraticum]